LEDLKNEYDYQMRGIRIVRMEQKYQMTTRSEYFDEIKKILKNYSAGTLSQAALETLSIIAYRQPVTRAEIEQIRGVQSSSSLDLLIDKGLVRTAGKLDVPGKPIAFETTNEFLKLLNIEKLSYLPDYSEFANGIQLALDENLKQQLQ
jgi:segregation and condensation protein B